MEVLTRVIPSYVLQSGHLPSQKLLRPRLALILEQWKSLVESWLGEQRVHAGEHLGLGNALGQCFLSSFLLTLCLLHGIEDALVRRELEMITGVLFWAQHFWQIRKLLMHVQRVYKSSTYEVDWVLCQSVWVDGYLVLFMVKVGGYRSSTDICWLPSKQKQTHR